MSFGLGNAPGPSKGPWTSFYDQSQRFSLVFLDDIITFSRIADEQIEHVFTVFSLLHTAGVPLNLKKRKFFTETIDYFGHVIPPGQLKLASHTTDAICDLKLLRTVPELKSFLGPCNVY